MARSNSTARRARVFVASAAIALTTVLVQATPAEAHYNTCYHGTIAISGVPFERSVFYYHETVAGRHFHYYHHERYNFSDKRWQRLHNFSTEC